MYSQSNLALAFDAELDAMPTIVTTATPTVSSGYSTSIPLFASLRALEQSGARLFQNSDVEVKIYNVDRFVGKDIPEEVHEHETQLVVVLEGTARVTIKTEPISIVTLRAGDMVVIPRNTRHRIEQIETPPLRIFSFYVQHPVGQ